MIWPPGGFKWPPAALVVERSWDDETILAVLVKAVTEAGCNCDVEVSFSRERGEASFTHGDACRLLQRIHAGES